jgi:hypothetical protein
MLLLRGLFVGLLLVLVTASRLMAQPASAPTTVPSISISTRAGFDRIARPGAWTPVFVRIDAAADLSIDKPVDLLLGNPTRGLAEDVVRTPVAISPGSAATYTVYLRAGSPLDWPLAVTLIDRDTDRTLATAPQERATDPLIATGFGRLVGVSGDPAIGANVATQLTRVKDATPGRLDATLLPDVPLAYECIDVLVLSSVNGSTMSPDQLRAIDAWVRAGGSLLLWLDAQPIDPQSPLAALLPAAPGAPGVDARGMTVRSLAPKSGAVASVIDGLEAVTARHGLGRVVLLAGDPSTASFQSDAQVAQRWQLLLDATQLTKPVDAIDAIVTQMQFTGPASRWIEWRTLAIGFLVAMVLLGPVDCALLWMTGRNPRTWYTTAGWVLLLPAVLLSAYAPSNEVPLPALHRVTLADEVDGQTVRSQALIGAPVTQPDDRDALVWTSAARPLVTPPGIAARNRFAQLRTGQHALSPASGASVLWEERSLAEVPASIEVKASDATTLRVTNLTDAPFERLRVVRGDSYWLIDRLLAPDETIDVSLRPADAKRLAPRKSPVGFEQRMGVAPRDADDTITALSRVERPDATVVIAEQGTGETRSYVREWSFIP